MFSLILGLAVTGLSIGLGIAGTAIAINEANKNDERYEEQQKQILEQEAKADAQYAEQMRMAKEQSDQYQIELLKNSVDEDINTGDLSSTPYGRAIQASTNASNALRLNYVHSFGKTNRGGKVYGQTIKQ